MQDSYLRAAGYPEEPEGEGTSGHAQEPEGEGTSGHAGEPEALVRGEAKDSARASTATRSMRRRRRA